MSRAANPGGAVVIYPSGTRPPPFDGVGVVVLFRADGTTSWSHPYPYVMAVTASDHIFVESELAFTVTCSTYLTSIRLRVPGSSGSVKQSWSNSATPTTSTWTLPSPKHRTYTPTRSFARSNGPTSAVPRPESIFSINASWSGYDANNSVGVVPVEADPLDGIGDGPTPLSAVHPVAVISTTTRALMTAAGFN